MNARDTQHAPPIPVSRDAGDDPRVAAADAQADTVDAAQPHDPGALPHTAAPPTRAQGRSQPHESARAQVAGGATYVDDIPEVRGTL